MSETPHTPDHTAAPWKADGRWVETEAGLPIVETAAMHTARTGEAVANAARICACVNALEGFATATLQKLKPGDLLALHQALAHRGDIESILSGSAAFVDLLAACEAMLAAAAWDGLGGRTGRTSEAIRLIEAAVARAKGVRL